jgi:hypothetical protein
MTRIAPSVTIPGELLLEAIAHIDAVGSIATELKGGVETRLAESTSQLAAELVLHLYEPPTATPSTSPTRSTSRATAVRARSSPRRSRAQPDGPPDEHPPARQRVGREPSRQWREGVAVVPDPRRRGALPRADPGRAPQRHLSGAGEGDVPGGRRGLARARCQRGRSPWPVEGDDPRRLPQRPQRVSTLPLPLSRSEGRA